MKLLALDTATEACSVSLGIDDRRIDRYFETERGHAAQILPMIDAVLAEGGVALGELDAIAFGRGPGGFTGVRLAASIAQGLAFGAELGVVPVSDLAAVALRAVRLAPDVESVLVVNDARMKEVYWACFEASPDLKSPECEHVSPPDAVRLPRCAGRWAAAGKGLELYSTLADQCRAAGATLFPNLLPRASEVLELARIEVAAGRMVSPAEALPVYVREQVVFAAT